MTSPPRPLTNFKITQKCFLGDCLPNCLNGSAPLNKMTIKAKNRKTFKRDLFLGQWPDFRIISQKCYLGDPLPKLLKWFHSAEQNGLQNSLVFQYLLYCELLILLTVNGFTFSGAKSFKKVFFLALQSQRP